MKFILMFGFLSLIETSHGLRLAVLSSVPYSYVENLFSEYDSDYQDFDFTVSPNPAKNKLNITLPSKLPNAKVSVFNILGKMVYSGEISNFNGSINISHWNSGVYLVKVSTKDITKTKRFIKE